MTELTADTVLARLHEMQSDEELLKYQRYFKFGEGEYAHGDRFIGVRMGHVFNLAKEVIQLPPVEIERLMESDIHEARAAAMSIMAKQYQAKKTSPERRQELFELYLRRHDRINNWDLVDLAAYYVVGPHLVERPATSSTGWRSPGACGNAAPPSSPPSPSCAARTMPTPSPSPRS